MKSLYKYIFVLLAVFSIGLLTVNAKSTKSTKTETKETEKEEVKEVTETKEKEKVTLYLFRKTGCPYCAQEMEFLDTIVNKYKKELEIVVINVSASTDNQKLLQAVADELEISIQGLPFNIIGSKTQEGYAEILNDTFENLIKDAYETQPEDVVAKLIAKNEYKGLETTDLYEAMDEEGLEYSSKKGSKAKLENIIFIVVFSAAIIGLGTLIYLSRRK